MLKRTRKGALLLALALTLVTASRAASSAQEGQPTARPQPTPRAEVNIEVQVHLLVTSEGADGAPRVPQSLDAVVGQLRAALPSSDYRVAATFINRVRDGGTYEVKAVGGLPFGPPPAQLAPAPSFFQLAVSNVRLLDTAAAQPSIHVLHFWLGTKMPIQTATAAGDKPGGGSVIQYESAGLSTQLSVREGEPTLVGTLNAGRPGQLYAVVITARRAK
jgi:hypothetical protein